MNTKDFIPFFIAPGFLFLGILCFVLSALSLIGAYYVTTSYLILSFVFFLLGFTAVRFGRKILSET
jgi:hypothetical protein